MERWNSAYLSGLTRMASSCAAGIRPSGRFRHTGPGTGAPYGHTPFSVSGSVQLVHAETAGHLSGGLAFRLQNRLFRIPGGRLFLRRHVLRFRRHVLRFRLPVSVSSSASGRSGLRGLRGLRHRHALCRFPVFFRPVFFRPVFHIVQGSVSFNTSFRILLLLYYIPNFSFPQVRRPE